MDNWAKFLYNQAKEYDASMIDTSYESLNNLMILCRNKFVF